MSKRPINEKRAKKLANALKPPTPSYIDLVDYLVTRKKVTKKQAREMLLDGKVKVESHVVGRLEITLLGEKKFVLDPLLPADKRDDIVVLP